MPGTNTQHVPHVDKFVKTSEFQDRAKFFMANKCYTTHLKGTAAYQDFWKEEDFKCRFGMTNSKGISITGPHYFYLNYVQIKSEDKAVKRKLNQFPRFLAIDYDYFWILDKCRKEGKSLVLVKPRRTGFTYKSSATIAHEYNFYRDSVCVIGAHLEKLATTTMNTVLDNLNFLNTHTEWKKAQNPSTKDYVKARYQVTVDGTTTYRGYNSEVRKYTFLNNPSAAVGLTTNVFLFEEAGTQSNLIQSYNFSRPTWMDGDNQIGVAICQGTGGDMTDGTRDFAELFYSPGQYGFLEFDNVWDENKQGTKCGWFISSVRARLGEYKDELRRNPTKKDLPMVDDDGNAEEELALLSIMDGREIASKGSSSKALQEVVTQFPLTPSEAFLRTSGSVFPVIELQEHLANLETSRELQAKAQTGELYFNSENKLKFRADHTLPAITDYPLKKGDRKEGAIVIWEHPEMETDKNPFGLYVGSCDPFDMDQAAYSDSLGSFFIYKTYLNATTTSNQIVAEYTGRPESAVDFYENCRKLCIYYNAKCLYENQLKGLKNYFMEKNSLHMLHEQPNNMIKNIVKQTTVHRGYGVHMTKEIRMQCEIYMKQWLLEERTQINGQRILNLHTILSIPLLKELIAYDGEINTDRVSSCFMWILQIKENYEMYQETSRTFKPFAETDGFFKRKLFAKHKNNQFN